MPTPLPTESPTPSPQLAALLLDLNSTVSAITPEVSLVSSVFAGDVDSEMPDQTALFESVKFEWEVSPAHCSLKTQRPCGHTCTHIPWPCVLYDSGC